MAIALVTGSLLTASYTEVGSVVGSYSTSADSAGAWSVELPGNGTLTPDTSRYSVMETDPASRNRYVSNIVVPTAGGPYALPSLRRVAPAHYCTGAP